MRAQIVANGERDQTQCGIHSNYGNIQRQLNRRRHEHCTHSLEEAVIVRTDIEAQEGQGAVQSCHLFGSEP